VVGAVLAGLVVIAVASRSYRPFAGKPAGEREASTVFLSSLFSFALVLAAAGVLLAILVVLLQIRAGKPRPRSSALPGLIGYLVLIAVLAALSGRTLGLEPRLPASQEDTAVPVANPGEPIAAEPAPAPTRVRVVWPLVGGLVALLLAAAVVGALLVRRGSREKRLPREARAGLQQALDEAIEDLRREPDPRKAVVAAYARMEQALTVHGLPRRPAEAPYEYLTRAAGAIEAEKQMAALTELFEVAKFSQHRVGEAMRERAIAALVAVRDEVRAAV
jgi:hypothetical protein